MCCWTACAFAMSTQNVQRLVIAVHVITSSFSSSGSVIPSRCSFRICHDTLYMRGTRL